MIKIFKGYLSSVFLIGAVICGALFGISFPQASIQIKPIGQLWLNLIFTAVVPLIFFSISSTVSSIQDAKRFSKTLGWMLLIFIVTGMVAALLMLGTVIVFPPIAPVQLEMISEVTSENIPVLQKISEALATGDLISLLSRSNMLALIVFSGLIGWATFLSNQAGESFKLFLKSANTVMLKLIGLLMKFAPMGLFAYFADLAAKTGPQLLGTYKHVLLIYYPVALFYFFVMVSFYIYWAGGKEGMKKFWRHIMTPALTAFGTGSSLAAVPANLNAADKMGITREVSDVVIPVGATIHMDGSCLSAILKISVLFSIFGQPFHGIGDYSTAITVALLSGVVMGGVPGGGFLGEMMIISLYGFPAEALPIIAMVGAVVDPPATLVNSSGDTAASMIVSRLLYGKKHHLISN